MLFAVSASSIPLFRPFWFYTSHAKHNNQYNRGWIRNNPLKPNQHVQCWRNEWHKESGFQSLSEGDLSTQIMVAIISYSDKNQREDYQYGCIAEEIIRFKFRVGATNPGHVVGDCGNKCTCNQAENPNIFFHVYLCYGSKVARDRKFRSTKRLISGFPSGLILPVESGNKTELLAPTDR